jgi:chromosome segregation ATPase
MSRASCPAIRYPSSPLYEKPIPDPVWTKGTMASKKNAIKRTQQKLREAVATDPKTLSKRIDEIYASLYGLSQRINDVVAILDSQREQIDRAWTLQDSREAVAAKNTESLEKFGKNVTASLYALRDSTQKAFDANAKELIKITTSIQKLNERMGRAESASNNHADDISALQELRWKLKNVFAPYAATEPSTATAPVPPPVKDDYETSYDAQYYRDDDMYNY